MKVFFGRTHDTYANYKEVEVKNLRELLKLIDSTKYKRVVIEYRPKTDRWEAFRDSYVVEDYDDRRE